MVVLAHRSLQHKGKQVFLHGCMVQEGKTCGNANLAWWYVRVRWWYIRCWDKKGRQVLGYIPIKHCPSPYALQRLQYLSLPLLRDLVWFRPPVPLAQPSVPVAINFEWYDLFIACSPSP